MKEQNGTPVYIIPARYINSENEDERAVYEAFTKIVENVSTPVTANGDYFGVEYLKLEKEKQNDC